MSADKETRAALESAHRHATSWLDSLGDRPVPARADADAIADALGRDLPDGPTDAGEVVDLLASACEPGLIAMPSGRFFGFVIGGSHPAALAADWLVSAWDQNAGCATRPRRSPRVEEVAAAGCSTCSAARRQPTSASSPAPRWPTSPGSPPAATRSCIDAGWDLDRDGLAGAPRVRVLAGAERHDSVDLALRYLGLARPTLVAVRRRGPGPAGRSGRGARRTAGRPTIVLPAGRQPALGRFRPVRRVPSPIAHAHGAWVHVDGAFGLWAAASPRAGTSRRVWTRPTRGPPTRTRR